MLNAVNSVGEIHGSKVFRTTLVKGKVENGRLLPAMWLDIVK